MRRWEVSGDGGLHAADRHVLVDLTVAGNNPLLVGVRNDVDGWSNFDHDINFLIRIFKLPTFFGVGQFPSVAVDIHWIVVEFVISSTVSTVVDGVDIGIAFTSKFPVASDVRSPNIWVALIVVAIALTDDEVCAVISWCNRGRSTWRRGWFIGCWWNSWRVGWLVRGW